MKGVDEISREIVGGPGTKSVRVLLKESREMVGGPGFIREMHI